MKHRLITIKTFTSKQDLYLAQGLLRSYGIESYTADENIDIIIGTPISEGYKLHVDISNEKKSVKILKTSENKPINYVDNNYPKILIYIVSSFFLLGITILTLYNVINFFKQYYNFNNTDRFSIIYGNIINAFIIISCIEIYIKKRWSWYIFNSILVFNLLSIITIDYNQFFNQYSSFSVILSILLITVVLLFFYSNAVTKFFNIEHKNKARIYTLLIGGLILLMAIIFKPQNDNKIISCRYLILNGDTVYLGSIKYSGQLINYYKNGQIEIRGYYQNGIKNGKWEEYFINGQTKMICNYENGILNGKLIEYYPNGNIVSEGNLIKGYKDSTWNEYYYDNKVKSTVSFKDSLKHGISLEFYQNGQISKSENFENGIKNGEFKTWNDKGTLDSWGYYKNGNKDGLWKIWINGNIYIEENYINDQRDGLAKYYDKNGLIEKEGFYKNNLKNRIWKEYDDKGEIISEKMYKNDTMIKY